MQKTGKLYFNPHFRKGSDHNYTVVYAVFMISIHTSAREVTNPDPKLDPVSYISIHTSAREVTYPVRNIPASPGNFNPHFRKGSDRKLDSNICRSHISIHTSAREVTNTPVLTAPIADNFNPHFRKGSDFWFIFNGPCRTHFNPHFRKGSDDYLSTLYSCIGGFQSTLPQGKWQRPYMLRHPSEISIHTSAREVTKPSVLPTAS